MSDPPGLPGPPGRTGPPDLPGLRDLPDPPGLPRRPDLPDARSQQALAMHQFGVQDRRAGGAADRVVAERDELVVEDGTGTKTTDRHRHPAVAVRVECRLRPVLLREIH